MVTKDRPLVGYLSSRGAAFPYTELVPSIFGICFEFHFALADTWSASGLMFIFRNFRSSALLSKAATAGGWYRQLDRFPFSLVV